MNNKNIQSSHHKAITSRIPSLGLLIGVTILTLLSSCSSLPSIFAFYSTSTPHPTSILEDFYYVDGNLGFDSNPGTQTSPWQTIQKAANTAAAGSTVIVLAGTYAERVTVNRALTFQAQGTVTMQGFTVSADNVTIKGFTITDLSNWGVGILVLKGGGCDIENNIVQYNTMGGISLQGLPANPTATHNCIVRNNVLYRNGMFGLEIMGQDHLIEGNEISQTIQHSPCHLGNESWLDADGIRFFGGGHVFRNNKIHDIPYGSIGYAQTACNLANLQNLANDYNADPHIDCFQTFDGNGDHVTGHDILFDGNSCILPVRSEEVAAKAFQVADQAYNLSFTNNITHTPLTAILKDSRDITFLNNTFVGDPNDPSAWGIFMTNSQDVKIQNNIFVYQENRIGSIWPDSISKSSLTAGYNCVYRAGGLPWRPNDPGDVWGFNPLFVNETADDYHLRPASPCIDMGTNTGPLNDFDGNPRPQGTAYDIGAFEYMGLK